MTPNNASVRSSSVLPALTTALAALGLVSGAQAQVQVAGELLVNVDAVSLPFGPLTSITNSGTLGGVFEARGGAAAIPTIGQPNSNATVGIVFDGGDYLQHVDAPGGALVMAPATLVGISPTTTIEAWILNPAVPDEETIVSWGYRGGPEGSNMSFLYGSNPSYGAVGHWGAPDLGWNNGGGAPQPNVWHHLVYTFDGTTQSVYVDGALTNSEAVVLNTHAGTAINIGAQYDDSAGVVTAGLRASSTIARLRIHSEALTTEQVAGNYALEKPGFTLGPVVFLTHPQNVTTQEQRMVSFSITLQGEPPIGLQWYGNNAPLNGQNGTSMSFGPVAAGDNNTEFFAVASNFSAGASFFATSEVAVLTVLSDTVAPVFTTVRPLTDRTFELVFSESINAEDATNLANYVLTGPSPTPAITNAVQNALGDRIVLTVDAPFECEMYSIAVSNLRDRAPSANVMAPTTLAFLNSLPVNLKHRYTFNNSPGNATGATVPDLVSGANGVVLNGSGTATFTGERIALSGGSSSVAPYIDLPNRLLSTNSTNFGGSGKVTLEGWVKVTGVQSWSRIVDFGSSDIDPSGGFLGGEVFGPGGGGEGRDYVFFSAMNGTDTATRQIDFRNEDPAGGGGVFSAYGTGTFNQDMHFAVTWDESTGLLTVYENGVFKTTTITDDAMSDLNDVNVWLGRSNWVQDNNMQGEFDEFRLYDRILSTNEILFNIAGGPDNNFGSLTNLDLVLATNNLVTNIVERISVLGGFTIRGVQDLAPLGCVRFSSTDSNVAYISADGFIHTGVEGTATLTAEFGGLTTSEDIEVSADSTPPTLVSVRPFTSRSIELTYSEPVEIATSQEAGNYIIFTENGGALDILSVERLTDPSQVLITLLSPMPCEYITVNVSFVADQSPLFNQIPENSQISFFHFIAPGLQHRYTFNNAPTNNGVDSIVPDSVGTADALVKGLGSSFTGDRLVLPGGVSGTAAYVDLPNGLLTQNSTNNGGSGQITFEGWVQVTGGRTWSRILDIGSSGPCCGPGGEQPGPGGSGEGIDYLMYSAQVDQNVNSRRFEILNRDAGNLGAVTIDHPTAFNQMRQFVITWDERTGALRVYEDGVQVIAGSTIVPYTAINDVNVWLGRSNWGGDQNVQGEFDEFRIYDRVLTPAEVQASRALGADFAFGAITNIDLVLSTNTMQVNTTRPVTVQGGFTTAGLQELAASGCVRFSSSDSNVAFITAEGVVHAVAAGTAELTVSLGGTNDTETLTVVGDTTPPALVSAGARTVQSIELAFSEPVDEGTAEEPGSYTVSSASGPIVVTSAERLPDSSRVLLTLAGALPCEYITVSVTGVMDEQGVAIAPASSLSFMHFLPHGMKHRYTFNNPAAIPAGGIVEDAVGERDATVLGGGATFTGTRVTLPGGPSAAAAYVDLPNRLISTNSVNNGGSGLLTIEGWYRATAVRNWARVLDFGSTDIDPGAAFQGGELFGPGGGGEGRDYFFYSAMNGTDPNNRRIDYRNEDPGGGGGGGVDFPVTNFNQDVHFVITWIEGSGQISIFENGIFKEDFVTDDTMSDLNDLNVWLGRSNWTGDANMQGEIDEFRLYDRILSPSEILTHDVIGPDNTLGQPLALDLVQSDVVQIGRPVRPIALVDFTTVSNLDLTASGCIMFSSSDPSVITNGVSGLQAVGYGNSTVTASFSGLTTNVTITVGQTLRFNGLTPGTTATIEVTTTLAPAEWATAGTATVAPDGTVTFTDLVDRGPQAFYRAVSP
jgi:hypothetical protein